jgi:hypothetical protein
MQSIGFLGCPSSPKSIESTEGGFPCVANPQFQKQKYQNIRDRNRQNNIKISEPIYLIKKRVGVNTGGPAGFGGEHFIDSCIHNSTEEKRGLFPI